MSLQSKIPKIKCPKGIKPPKFNRNFSKYSSNNRPLRYLKENNSKSPSITSIPQKLTTLYMSNLNSSIQQEDIPVKPLKTQPK